MREGEREKGAEGVRGERKEREEQYQFWVPVRPPPQLSPGQCSSAPHCTPMSLPAQHCLHTPGGREGEREREGEGGREREGGRGREREEGGKMEVGRMEGEREGRRKEGGNPLYQLQLDC